VCVCSCVYVVFVMAESIEVAVWKPHNNCEIQEDPLAGVEKTNTVNMTFPLFSTQLYQYSDSPGGWHCDP